MAIPTSPSFIAKPFVAAVTIAWVRPASRTIWPNCSALKNIGSGTTVFPEVQAAS